MPALLFTRATYLAPGDTYHVVQKPIGNRLGTPHHHDYFELFVVEEGTCQHRVNEVDEWLPPGAMVFIRPDDTHALAAHGGAACRILNLIVLPETVAHLTRRYADDLAGRFFDSPGALPVTVRLSPAAHDRALRVIAPLQTGPRRLARVEAVLLALMAEMTDLPASSEAAMPVWLARACDAARRPDVYRKGASGLVEVAGRGHEHVCRQMKRHIGLTPSAFVNGIRLDRAAELLAQGDQTMQEIATEIGLDNLSHFHRLFRGRFAMTPREWRRRHGGTPF